MTPDLSDAALAKARDFLTLAARHHPAAVSGFHCRRGLASHGLPAGVHQIANAVVLSGEWIIIAGERFLFDSFVQSPTPPLSAYFTPFQGDSAETEIVYRDPVKLSFDTAFLLGGSSNICHWLFDFLPRLALCKRGHPLLVNAPLTAFQLATLDHLGVPRDTLVQLPYPGAYEIPRLAYPTLASSIALEPLPFNAAIVAWLRGAFTTLIHRDQRRRRLFVARDHHDSPARLVNHEEIADIAIRHGFEIVRPESLAPLEQIALFAGAAAIVGPHGAGLSHLLWAPHATLFELMGPAHATSGRRTAETYRLLARACGSPYKRLVGTAAGPTPDFLPSEAYQIHPERFADLLATL